METSQLICIADRRTGFYGMGPMASFAFNSVCASSWMYIKCISFIIFYRGRSRTHAASLMQFFVTLMNGDRCLELRGASSWMFWSPRFASYHSLLQTSDFENGYNTTFCFGNKLERFAFYSKYHKRKVSRLSKQF